MSEASAASHLRTMRLYCSLLVGLLDLTSVEDEALLGLTTKDQHIGVVELDATAWLSAHKLRVTDLKLDPSHTCDYLSILTAILVTLKLGLRAGVELLNAEGVTGLGLAIASRHQVDPPLVHYDGRRIDRSRGQRSNREPMIGLGIEALR